MSVQLRILQMARELIAANGWCQRNYAKFNNKAVYQYLTQSVDSWGIQGAISFATNALQTTDKAAGINIFTPYYVVGNRLVLKMMAIKGCNVGRDQYIGQWEDLTTTTKEDVLALFDLLIVDEVERLEFDESMKELW